MVIDACNKTDTNGLNLPSMKQSNKPIMQDHGLEYQCTVSKVQTSLLSPWLAVDDGEWRPSGDIHDCNS
jgi:hypothetical protein